MILDVETDPSKQTPESLRKHAATMHKVATFFEGLADQWEAKLPKPRMDEPAWGEKVIASCGLHPTVIRAAPRVAWLKCGSFWRTRDGSVANWRDLENPEPYTPEGLS